MDFRKLAEVSSLAMTLPAGIAVGLFVGYGLDRWLKTDPWMLILWTLLGVASGFLNLLRGLRKYEKDNPRD